MLLSLMFSVSAFFGLFAKQNLPNPKIAKASIIRYKISHGKPMLNKWFSPANSNDLNLYKNVVLNIDDGIFPEVPDEEVRALDPGDEYTRSILKALLELSELPEPDSDHDVAKYTRGPFSRPADNTYFTIHRAADQRYKMDIQQQTGRQRRSPEEDVGDEEEDHKKKPKSKSENETKKKDKGGKADGGRIVGGVSSLQFTNVNHKFRSSFPG